MKLLIDAGLATPSTGRDAVDVAGAVKLRLNDKFAGRFTLAQLYGVSFPRPPSTEHQTTGNSYDVLRHAR